MWALTTRFTPVWRSTGLLLTALHAAACGNEVLLGENRDAAAHEDQSESETFVDGADAGAENTPETSSGDGDAPSGNDASTQTDASAPLDVAITPVGAPTWRPVDFQNFAAPFVSSSTGFDGSRATLDSVFGTLHVFSGGVYVPGTPHAPPYDGELERGVKNAGFVNTAELPSVDLKAPSGLYLAFFLVPDVGAAVGRSPDYASGPILPDSLFPISIQGDLYQENSVANPNFDSGYPPLSMLMPSASFDGYSHLPLIFATNMEFSAPPAADYSWRFELRDTTGAGWSITLAFRLTPTPCESNAECADVGSQTCACGLCLELGQSATPCGDAGSDGGA
jgi:hypothetical protein